MILVRSLCFHNVPSFCLYFKEEGILHETSCPYTPEQNKTALQRGNIDTFGSRALLKQALRPFEMTKFRISCAAHLINRIPTKRLNGKSPNAMRKSDYPSGLHHSPQDIGLCSKRKTSHRRGAVGVQEQSGNRWQRNKDEGKTGCKGPNVKEWTSKKNAPVSRFETIRLVTGIAAAKGWNIFQLDGKSA